MGFITRNEFKIYFLIVGSIALIAVLITLVIFLPGYLRYQTATKKTIQKTIDTSQIISELKIPEEYSQLLDQNWIHYYKPGTPWTKKDSKPYWVDPKKMALKYLDAKNSKMIKDMLDKYE